MAEKGMQVKQWPVSGLVPHPDNPRTVRTSTQEYKDLLESVKANGVIEPLLVRLYVDPNAGLDGARKALGVQFRQVLSGHHRLKAAQDAGLDTVPVIDRGQMADDAAYDIVAMGNIRVPLTPLEEGKRAATWLDKYGQDAQAVAGKLGQTPRWVVEHAQISRGLSSDWHKAAAEIPAFDRWTSSHWAVIAKLPARIQAEQLGKFRNNAFCSYDRWTVKELERRIDHQTFRLAKAPFPRGSCASCVNRTGQQPLFLYADTADGATGDNELCLDRKCWQRKCEKAEREAFKQIVVEKGLENAVPLSLLQAPQDSWGKSYEEYRKKVSSCRRAHKGLVTADQVKIVKENTPGAVPAIVVAGVGKGTTKWVKVKPVKEESSSRSGPRQPTTKEIERDKEFERWERVCEAAMDRIRQMPAPSAEVILLMQSLMDAPEPDLSEVDTLVRTWQKDRETFGQKVRDWFWQAIVNPRYGVDFIEGERETLEQLGPVLGIDIEADYQAMVGADAKAQAIQEKTEIVPVELPKKFNCSCSLRLLQDGDKWFGGYAVEIPKGRVDVAVDTGGQAYETKGRAVKAMAEAAAQWLAERKAEKKCPVVLYQPLATAIAEVVGACELELARSTDTHGPAPTGCGRDCVGCAQLGTCNGDQLPGPAAKIKPAGLIEDYEKISVPTEKGWQARIALRLGTVAGKWYVGWDVHVPGGAFPLVCSTENQGYTSRDDALRIARHELDAWLANKPGKKAYKHYEVLRQALGKAIENAMTAPAAGKPVMRCSFPPAAREPIAEPARGDRKCRVCKMVDQHCTHCAGTVCPVCVWEEADLCAVCATQGKGGPPRSSAKSIASGRITFGLKPRPKTEDRDGPPQVDAVRVLTLVFPASYRAGGEVWCQRIDDRWHGGFELIVGRKRKTEPIETGFHHAHASKAACLEYVVAIMKGWLEDPAVNISKRDRVQIAARIEETIEDELAKRTCRVCGCTEDDCQACVEVTGEACHWVEEDLCSRCQGQ